MCTFRCAEKKFLAYMSAYCLQNSEKVKNRPFFARACDKKGVSGRFARNREKILKFHAIGALE